MTPQEIADEMGVTNAHDLLQELRDAGWHPDGTADGSRDSAIQVIAAGLDRHVPGWREEPIRPAYPYGYVVSSPWPRKAKAA